MSLTEAMIRIAALKRGLPAGAASPPTEGPQPEAGRKEAEPAPDVFISYAMPDDEALAAALEDWLSAKGYRVWRAAGIVGGETPHRAIGRALLAARAVVVLWSPASIDLDWVYSEAKRASKRNKLIPVRTLDIDHDDIPPPFDTVQTLGIDDQVSLEVALKRLGIVPGIAKPAA